jgi:hypothetical protein
MHLKKQVIQPLANKKVVIVIVEGVSDERALSSIRKYVQQNFGIHIHLTYGDVFSEFSNRKSIKAVIGDQVLKVMNERKFRKKEILAVIQITDTDGAFIDDDSIKIDESISEKVYLDDTIMVPDQKGAVNIKQRNKFKAANLRTMYSALKVQQSLDYYLLYFSCNLDHVLHNVRNLEDEQKDLKAKEFNRRYKRKPNDFLEFFLKGSFAVKGSHKETWEFIQVGNNSLHQYSNFHLIFDILDNLSKGN